MTNYWPFRTYMDHMLDWEHRFGGLPHELVSSGWQHLDGEAKTQHNGRMSLQSLSALPHTQRYKVMLNRMLPMLATNTQTTHAPGMTQTLELKLESINTVYEYIWESEQRHTWQVSPEVLEFLAACSCECKTSEYLLPWDVLVLTFPLGFVLPQAGLPLRSLMIGRVRSQMAKGLALKLVQSIQQPRPVTFYSCDFGEQMPVPGGKAVYTWDNDKPSIRSFVNVVDGESIEDFNMPKANFMDGEFESAAMREAVILGSTLIWLAKAKPEFLKSERIKCKPHARHPKVVGRLGVPPLYLNAVRRIGSGDAEATDLGPHWHVRPHMRGFSLRELRNERYHRNPDGSCRIILVEPYFVGGAGEADNEVISTHEVRL